MRRIEDYNINEPLSSYAMGNPDAPAKIFLLHSSERNARWPQMWNSATYLSNRFPNAEIIAINGMEKRQKPHRLSGEVAYDWGSLSRKHEKENELVNLIRSFGGGADKTVLLGHSEGGFRAARLVYRYPDLADHAVLHSAALLLYNFEDHPASTSGAKTFDTVLSPADPYAKTPMVLGLALHAKNSLCLAWQGHATKTTISNGFKHGINDKSIALCADIIEHRLQPIPG